MVLASDKSNSCAPQRRTQASSSSQLLHRAAANRVANAPTRSHPSFQAKQQPSSKPTQASRTACSSPLPLRTARPTLESSTWTCAVGRSVVVHPPEGYSVWPYGQPLWPYGEPVWMGIVLKRLLSTSRHKYLLRPLETGAEADGNRRPSRDIWVEFENISVPLYADGEQVMVQRSSGEHPWMTWIVQGFSSASRSGYLVRPPENSNGGRPGCHWWVNIGDVKPMQQKDADDTGRQQAARRTVVPEAPQSLRHRPTVTTTTVQHVPSQWFRVLAEDTRTIASPSSARTNRKRRRVRAKKRTAAASFRDTLSSKGEGLPDHVWNWPITMQHTAAATRLQSFIRMCLRRQQYRRLCSWLSSACAKSVLASVAAAMPSSVQDKGALETIFRGALKTFKKSSRPRYRTRSMSNRRV